MTLRSPYGNYGDVVGLRNSHDNSFPIGIAFGSCVFVCDNTAFVGEHVIRRKHTVKAKRELPGLVTEIVAPLTPPPKDGGFVSGRVRGAPKARRARFV